MNNNGYIYVLMNPSLQNMVKIGKTTRTPEERAKELSASTGVPTPFVVVYSNMFEDCSIAENFIHTYLESKGFRVSTNREFFEIPINEAIDSVIKAKEYFGEYIFNNEKTTNFINTDFNQIVNNPWEDTFNIGYSYFTGENNYLQDYKEAEKYFKKATALGSVLAYSYLSMIYTYGKGTRIDLNKGLEYSKQGLDKGYIAGYEAMANIYIKLNHIDNAIKCWENYVNYWMEKEDEMLES